MSRAILAVGAEWGGGVAHDPHVLGPVPSRSNTQVPKVRN